MARKRIYSGELIQIRVNQTNLYHRQWAVPRGQKKPYIISETIQKEDGTYVRKHPWVCGCMDWISRRQKLRPPHDRCKHIDAVIRQFATSNDASDLSHNLGSLIDTVETLPRDHFQSYQPMLTVNNNWSGTTIPLRHIVTLPSGATPITVTDNGGSCYPVGYIKNRTAYLGMESHHLQSFDYDRFFNIMSKRSFSPKENKLLLEMEEQRNRMERNFGESVVSEIQVLDGKLSQQDREMLDRLVSSGTIDDYEVIDTSIILRYDQRCIKTNGRVVWQGDYLVIIGKMSSFSVMGKNIVAGGTSRSGGVHPHVNASGRPCLAGYNQMVIQALQKRDWIKFSVIISDFLTQYNRNSSYLTIH